MERYANKTVFFNTIDWVCPLVQLWSQQQTNSFACANTHTYTCTDLCLHTLHTTQCYPFDSLVCQGGIQSPLLHTKSTKSMSFTLSIYKMPPSLLRDGSFQPNRIQVVLSTFLYTKNTHLDLHNYTYIFFFLKYIHFDINAGCIFICHLVITLCLTVLNILPSLFCHGLVHNGSMEGGSMQPTGAHLTPMWVSDGHPRPLNGKRVIMLVMSED